MKEKEQDYSEREPEKVVSPLPGALQKHKGLEEDEAQQRRLHEGLLRSGVKGVPEIFEEWQKQNQNAVKAGVSTGSGVTTEP